MKTIKKILGVTLIASSLFAFSAKDVRSADSAGIDTYKARIEKIASGLEPVTGLKAKITVSPEPSRNAFVMPDGTIMITKGLISTCKSDDEVAFILAHEVCHILAKDHTNYSAELNSPKDLPDSQIREINADINAVYYTKKAGYNPDASLSILGRIAPESNSTFARRLRTLSRYLETLKH